MEITNRDPFPQNRDPVQVTGKSMKAKVKALLQDRHHGTDRPTVIHDKVVKIGDIIETDENTFRNLHRKGVLEAHDAEAKAVDLELPSQLSEAAADANAKQTVADREAAAERTTKAAKKIKNKK
jgi:hypothetical protein